METGSTAEADLHGAVKLPTETPSSSPSLIGAILVYLLLAAGLAVTDLVTKSMVLARHFSPTDDYQHPWWFVEGVLGVQVSFNRGALFGIAQGYSWLFAAISVAFIVLLLGWLFVYGAWRDRSLTMILAMVTGGILGNLYDRLGFGYCAEYPAIYKDSVRDWIHFRWEGISFLDPWPNFNLADSYLVVGALLMLIHSLLQRPAASQD